MERSLIIKTRNEDNLKTLFVSKKEDSSENFSIIFNKDVINESIKYNMDNEEIEKDHYDELNDSLRKSTKWTDGSVILNFFLMI
jgi:hypothetical protein